MKKSAANVAFCCLVVGLVVLIGGVKETTAVVCKVTELSPCTAAIVGSGVPSAECCVKLREQVPCLCIYIRDPSLAPFVNSPNSPKIAAACRITIPKC